MKKTLLIAGLVAGIALPLAAQAQPYDPGCVQANHDNHVAGTIIGGITGAVIGGAIAGRHSTGAGVAIGGVTGAVAGNAISRSNDHPCPDGYTYQGAYQGAPPSDGADFWAGAPRGVHERIDFMQSRIDTSGQNGWISRRESYDLNSQLNDVRRQDQDMRYRDGGHLSPTDRDYLQSRLDDMSQRLHWMARD